MVTGGVAACKRIVCLYSGSADKVLQTDDSRSGHDSANAKRKQLAGHFRKSPARMITSFFGSMYFRNAAFTSSGVSAAIRFSSSLECAKVRPSSKLVAI